MKLADPIDPAATAPAVVTGAARVVEHQMALFNTWADRFLADATPQHRQTLATYLRWGQQHRLARSITVGTFATWATLISRQQLTQAAALLDWLDDRHVTLAELDQRHLDRWLTSGTTSRTHANHFIGWAQRQRLTSRHTRLPRVTRPAGTPLPAGRHRQLITTLINDETIPARDRIAGLLVTLYAQPVSRIIQLQHRHIHTIPTGIQLELGSQPIDTVQPLAALLAEHTANNADPDEWIFPGTTAGQPISAKTLGQRLLRHGVNRAARVTALHHLINTIPTPVLADLIGYNPNFIAEQAIKLGTPWAHYAAIRTRT